MYPTKGLYPQTWNAFRNWGPHSIARFDHHEPPTHAQERAVLYCARSVRTCIAEVFQRTSVVERYANAPFLVSFTTTSPLWLVDLRGPWPTIAAASTEINSSSDRERTQAWARAIYEAYPQAHGICNASSVHANEPSLVLIERAIPFIARSPVMDLPYPIQR